MPIAASNFYHQDPQRPSGPTDIPPPAATRETWADALKGLLIVLVVLWHVILKSYLQIDWQLDVPIPGAWGLIGDLIWPFLMPLFLLVSGYFASTAAARPWSAVIHSRVLRFVWLYLLWTLIHAVALWAFPDFPTFVPRSIAEAVEAVTISPMDTWYLYALVVYFVLAKALIRVPAWIVIGVAAGLSIVTSAGLIEVVSNRGSLLYNFTFFLLGLHLAPRIRQGLTRIHRPTVGFLIAAYASVFTIMRLTDSETVPGVWPIVSLVGVAAVLAAAPILPKIPLAGAALRHLGRRSLPIYLLHLPLLALIDHFLGEWLSESRPAVQLLAAVALPVLLTAVVVLACLGLDRLIRRDGLVWLWDLPRRAGAAARKPWRTGVAILLLVVGGVAGTRATAIAGCPENAPTKAALSPGQVRLGAVGDVLIHDIGHGVPADDGANHFDAVRPWFTQDLVMGNLEQVIANDTGFVKCRPGDECLAFRSDPATAQYLKGFDLMNMANNHTGDFGVDGYRQTRANLAANGIRAVGARDEITCTRIGNTTVAVVGFAPYSGTNRLTDLRHARKVVAAAAASADIVVVQAHMGAEGPDANVVRPGPERMYGENRGDVTAFSHAVIDAGADIVLGHGPHTLRGIDLYKGKLVAYSLGNFGGGGVFGAEQATRYGIYLDVTLNKDGTLARGQAHSITFDFADGRPVPDLDDRAAQIVDRFSQRDFPHTAPRIGPHGLLSPR